MIDDLDLHFALSGVRRAWVSEEVSTTIIPDTDWDMPYDDDNVAPLDDEGPISCDWLS
ncbi:hypothetical protein O4G98_01120 [Zoogloeaceae bacterium G21618-S1]|jgi:hypothetical protein|nr:hypothetical protein [Zoogloeaceae bacterium G21618-S1]